MVRYSGDDLVRFRSAGIHQDDCRAGRGGAESKSKQEVVVYKCEIPSRVRFWLLRSCSPVRVLPSRRTSIGIRNTTNSISALVVLHPNKTSVVHGQGLSPSTDKRRCLLS